MRLQTVVDRLKGMLSYIFMCIKERMRLMGKNLKAVAWKKGLCCGY
jgi:hypothetical protein